MNPIEMKFNSHRLLEMANDANIDAVILLDTGLRVISWNNSAELIFNIPQHEALDELLLNLLPSWQDDKDCTAGLQNALTGFKTFLPASKKDVFRTHTENHIIPLKNDTNRIEGVLIITHDVSHRILAEQRLQFLNAELEKRLWQLKTNTKDMAAFTAVISQDIKVPLRNLYTGIEQVIINEAARLSNGTRAFFRKSQSSVNRMGRHLDSLLTIVELNAANHPAVTINTEEVLEEQLVHLNDKINATGTVVTKDPLCKIKGHRNQLGLLLYHLVDNAIKFNKEAVKRIHISCTEVKLNAGESPISSQLEYNKLSVRDNGIGLSDGEKDKVFELFLTLHGKEYTGNGIGLAIVQKIMESHEGFVKISAAPGGGTTFDCFFPV